jgi:hypothetical protein
VGEGEFEEITWQPGGVAQAGLQQPPRADETGREGILEKRIQTEPPGPERLFRLESEFRLRERIRQEARVPGVAERVVFPEEPPLPAIPFAPRAWAPSVEHAEPYYLCHRRLYFEQPNSERYGWELSFLQPFVSAGKFYFDVLFLPYHMATEPCRHYECSAGQCLPGDPVPYLIPPPQISLTGIAAQGAVVTGLAIAFP